MTMYSTEVVYRSMSMRYSSLRYIAVPGIKGLILQQGLVSLLGMHRISGRIIRPFLISGLQNWSAGYPAGYPVRPDTGYPAGYQANV
jgi:hypothetical protein